MKMSVFLNQGFLTTFGELMKQELPIKTAYKLKKIQKSLVDEEERFNELRKEVLTKYAIKNDEGEPQTNEHGNVDLNKDKLEDFQREFNDLLSIEFSSEFISLDELGDIKLSVNKLNTLDDLIKE